MQINSENVMKGKFQIDVLFSLLLKLAFENHVIFYFSKVLSSEMSDIKTVEN